MGCRGRRWCRDSAIEKRGGSEFFRVGRPPPSVPEQDEILAACCVGSKAARRLSYGRKAARNIGLCSDRTSRARPSLALVPAPFGILSVPFGSQPPGDRPSGRTRRTPMRIYV